MVVYWHLWHMRIYADDIERSAWEETEIDLMARETPGWIRKVHVANAYHMAWTLHLLHITQIQFVLYNLEALCLTTEWQYASGLSHDAANICLVELIILHLVQSTNQTVTDPRT